MKTPDKPLVIVVQRKFEAAAERVFDAWLDPYAAGKWLFATPAGKMQRVEIDPRVGGKFIVAEQRGDVLAEHFGRYVEIDRPRRLVFLFSVTKFEDPNAVVSKVTIEIAPQGTGCELTLTHEIDPQWAGYVDRTRSGWTTMLENLSKNIATNSEPVVVERVIDAPVAAVWAAITTPEAIRKWFCEFKNFEAVVGREFEFTADDKGVSYLHHCQVTGVIPEQRLAYTWRYTGYTGDSLVAFDLSSEGSKTRIRVTHTGLETFPQISAFAKGNFEQGWTALVGTLLPQYLAQQNTGAQL